jgi:hypothetical protein
VVRRSYTLVAILFLIASAVDGCVAGKRPFLTVQVCLKDERGVAEFASMLQSLAHSEHMRFIDHSLETQREMATISHDSHKSGLPTPAIAIDMGRGDGMGVGATNLGLTSYQVALGFSDGLNPLESHRFADAVVSSLQKHWHVEIVVPGTGARSLKACEADGRKAAH